MQTIPIKHGCFDHVKLLAVRLFVPFVVICLLFAPLLANLSSEQTRYDLMWQTSDAVYLTAGILSMTAAAAAVGARLRRARCFWLQNAPDGILIVSLGAGLFANIAFYADQWMHIPFLKSGAFMHTGWLLLMLLAGCAWTRPGFVLVRRARQLTLILAPAACIMVTQLFFQTTFPSKRDPLPPLVSTYAADAAPSGSVDRPVYLFLFDAWSYERSYDNDKLCTRWKNLAALSERSLVFHDAHSLGGATMPSLPRLLFQRDDEVTWRGSQMGFEHADQFIPASQCDSLFSIVAGSSYRTFMIGTGCPYNLWLDGHVDVCRSYSYYRPEADTPARAMADLLAGIQYWTDPCFPALYWNIQKPFDKALMRRLYRESACDIFDIISRQPRRTFAVFHYLLPHPPYLFAPNGSYISAEHPHYTTDNPQGYQRNLACLDYLIGRFVETMKQAQRFDDALIILSSDHSWHQDPERKKGRECGSICHVPLIVKLPGQHRSLEVTTRFTHKNLGELIQYALTAGPNPEVGIEPLLAALTTDQGIRSPSGKVPVCDRRINTIARHKR